jgi:hypothetical protein
VKINRKGRVRTRRNWFLVLHNTLRGPVSDVDFKFVNLPRDALFRVQREDGLLGTILPAQEVRLPLLLAMESPDTVDYAVTWTDSSGERPADESDSPNLMMFQAAATRVPVQRINKEPRHGGGS